jgi:CO dehydrogenase maturation factor
LLARHTVGAPDGVRLLATGAAAPLLDRLADGEREYVVLDLAADAFTVALCTRFDMTVLVAEPTRRDIGLYRQCAEKASGHGVELRVLGNKISDGGDTT